MQSVWGRVKKEELLQQYLVDLQSSSAASSSDTTAPLLGGKNYGVNTQALVDTEITLKRVLNECFDILSDEPSVDPPSGLQHDATVVTFTRFLEGSLFPLASSSNGSSGTNNDPNALLKFNRIQKDRRSFVIKHWHLEGYPGACKPGLVEMRQELLQKAPKEDLDVQGKEQHIILPSFFRMLEKLIFEDHVEDELIIVFRTFGDLHDIEKVTVEWNRWVTGKHPLSQHFSQDQIKVLSRYVLDLAHAEDEIGNHRIGFFWTNRDDRMWLLTGSVDRPAEMDRDLSANRTLDSYIVDEVHRRRLHVYEGHRDIYSYLCSLQPGAYSYRDFYYWWSANSEQAHAGKSFIVDTESNDVYQLFFDDNILMEGENKGIVNLRDVNTGKFIAFEDGGWRYLQDVHCLESILDPNYFYDAFQRRKMAWENRRGDKQY